MTLTVSSSSNGVTPSKARKEIREIQAKKVPKGIRVRKGNRVYRDCVESVESVALKEPEARRERRERRETGALKEPEARKGRKEIQARRDRGGR
jgi:hypothetical protein